VVGRTIWSVTRRGLAKTLLIAGVIVAIGTPVLAMLVGAHWVGYARYLGLAAAICGILLLQGPRYVILPEEHPRVSSGELDPGLAPTQHEADRSE
jgi:hypothetical protein